MTDKPKKLPESYIVNGNFVYFEDEEFWDCITEIVDVNYEARTFKVRRIDTLDVEKITLNFDMTSTPLLNKISLTPVSLLEVIKLVQHGCTNRADQVGKTQKELDRRKLDLTAHLTYLRTLLSRSDVVGVTISEQERSKMVDSFPIIEGGDHE